MANGNKVDQRIGVNRGWVLGASGQEVADALNNNFRIMSVLLQSTVKSAAIITPPSSVLDGDAYIIPTGATGDWQGHVGEIAQYDYSIQGWFYVKVRKGFSIYVDDEDKTKILTATGWKNVVFET
ncbi:DUF2793 domain-containing protein [Acinetobacter bereziniae]|uniref:DUF2793 domain-containing protein n=1 Tax=Acinetobacter bereziniae TaxID=106648 RepID=UPI000EF6FCF1|nr:DUF2793 domain-containing protein [Acinetobacter bereziniae]